MGHDVGPIHVCMFVHVLIAWLCRSSDSLPIDAHETGSRLTPYDTLRYSGRTLKAVDWEACEYGDTLQPYDEDCPNGAVQVLPCNPGQLKVSECIGQDGDTSRMCEPCPQKYFQSSYNKCTACHPCSECGANEKIRQPCTDETDTICESIIPPLPQPTTTLTDVTDARGQSSTLQPNSESTQNPTTAVFTSEETTKTTKTEGPVTDHTTQSISAPPPGRNRNEGSSGVTLGIGISAAISWIVILILLVVLWNTCGKLKKEKRKNRDLTERLAALRTAAPSANAERLSHQGASVQISNGANGSLRPERRVTDHDGFPETQRRDPFVDNPCDEKPSLYSRLLNSLSPLLPSHVVKDSGDKKRGKKASPRVTFHNEASGDSHSGLSNRGPVSSITLTGLSTGDRGKSQKSSGTTKAESSKGGGGALCAPEATSQVDRRDGDNPRHCNGEFAPSTITTVDVHNSANLPGERECGDGDSLVTNGIVRDGHPYQGGDSCDQSLADRDNLGSHPGYDTDHSNHDLQWPAEKVPESSVLPPSSTYSNELSTEVPPLDSDERWHAEKVPRSFALPSNSMNGNMSSPDVPPTDVPPKDVPSVDNDEPLLAEKVPEISIKEDRVRQDPDTVSDAPLDNTPVEDHNPRTLRSSAEIPEAPIAEEEDLPEDKQDAARANNDNLDIAAATADPDRDVLRNLMEPEATVFNNNGIKTTPPDGKIPEDTNGREKPSKKKKSFLSFKKQKRKDQNNSRNYPPQQTQPLLQPMDKMVDEECLDYVAGQLKLKKLDKLCRELGLRETDVENYRYELEGQHRQGAELAFQMLVKIRDSQGVRFTYGKLNRALRASNNVHVADAMVAKFHLQ